jgi:hypothetical protein
LDFNFKTELRQKKYQVDLTWYFENEFILFDSNTGNGVEYCGLSPYINVSLVKKYSDFLLKITEKQRAFVFISRESFSLDQIIRDCKVLKKLTTWESHLKLYSESIPSEESGGREESFQFLFELNKKNIFKTLEKYWVNDEEYLIKIFVLNQNNIPVFKNQFFKSKSIEESNFNAELVLDNQRNGYSFKITVNEKCDFIQNDTIINLLECLAKEVLISESEVITTPKPPKIAPVREFSQKKDKRKISISEKIKMSLKERNANTSIKTKAHKSPEII